VLSELSCKRLTPSTPDIDVGDAAVKPKDNCRNIVESSAAVTLHVASKDMAKNFVTLENVRDVLCVLND